jgi:DNA segregation ATPase FtsK/SpoIIIE-like protein
MMRLFISYARIDITQVKPLVEILRTGGHDPWFDRELLVGDDWKAQLQKALEASDGFVYALTPDSVASEWCQWEFAEAVRLGKPVIPVLIREETVLPPSIAARQYADFSDGVTGQAVARLLGGLAALAQKIPKKEVHAPASPSGSPASVDELYDRAVEVAKEQDGISIALLQRMIKIGRTRAKKLVEMMASQGVLGTYDPVRRKRPFVKH